MAALLFACLAAPVADAAVRPPALSPTLSPRLAKLARPALRSASRAKQASRLGLPVRGPGSLLRDGSRVLVEARFDSGAAAAAADLRDAGGEVVDLSRRSQTVTVAVRPAQLRALGRVDGVKGVTEVLAPVVRAADCGGSVRSEGDAQLGAADARDKWGVDGSGVTVGILSDSFDRAAGAATHAAGDVASGDLPGSGSPCGSSQPVGVLDDSEGAGHDEGRAMAQVVHDLAPGAAIDFATAFTGEAGFADNIRALANAGAKVIADDVAYQTEPFFQDGPVAQAINEVTAQGVSYFTAAGNDNLIDAGGNDIASWEAQKFRDGATEAPPEGCPAGLPAYATHCMDFDLSPATTDTGFGIKVKGKATLTIDLQWAQPWNGVTTDLDGYLLSGGTLLTPEPGSEVHNVAESSQQPVEILTWKNPEATAKTVELAINRCDDLVCDPVQGGDEGTPRLKFILLENGSEGVSEIEYPESKEEGEEKDTVGPAIYGHSGAQNAISVGAVSAANIIVPAGELEEYSSRGPVTHYFGPVSGTTAAAPLPSPQEISKPDIVATDCGVTTFFAQFFVFEGVWRFCGTSAAAPHAAAIAALVRQANPGVSAAQVRADLASTAHPVGAFGPEAVGAGLLDADPAVNAVALPPQVAIGKQPAPLSRDPRPTIEFSANRPVSFACAIDGAAAQPCASPFIPPTALADGEHSFAVTGTDLAGRTGSSSIVHFRIDTTAPQTFISAHPRKVLRTRHRRVRAVFRFRSDEPEAIFLCKADREAQRVCGARFQRRYALGKHVLRVRAEDAAGNLDVSAAIFRFQVKRTE